MSGRTPSFIVVGLVIIMFLLGMFYMSCSSKNNELRVSLEQFEERYRSLTLKNSDAEKKNENLNSRKRELEEEKSNIQRQMEKKDSEVNDLNTKLNEKITELKSLQSDKQVLDEQLKDYKSLNETIAAKNTLIEKLLSQVNEKKQLDEQFNQLKQDYEALKTNLTIVSSTFPIPPQRFRPIETSNSTTKSLASLFKDSADKVGNLTKEVKARMVGASLDAYGKIRDAVGLNNNLSSTTTTVADQQNLNNNDPNQQQADQNVPAPPLANQNQQKQQANHVDSAQGAPPLADPHVAVVDNSQYQNKLQRALNKSLTGIENDDEEELSFDNLQDNRNRFRSNSILRNGGLDNPPSFVRQGKKSYRVNDREPLRNNRKHFREHPQQYAMDHGGEIDAHEDAEYRAIRKRNLS